MNNFVKTTSRLESPSNVAKSTAMVAALDFAAEEPAKLDDSSEIFALRLDTSTCPACGTESDRSDVFCISCGEFLEAGEEQNESSKKAYCTACGAAVEPEEIFCLSCGSVLD